MKKSIAWLLTAVMVLGVLASGGITVFAAEALPENCCLVGDFDGNGKITAVDARWALQAASGVRTYRTADLQVLDCNADGRLTATDARWILQTASGARGTVLVNTVTGERETLGTPTYTQAQAAELLRTYTKQAAAGNYTVQGNCNITKDVDIGGATEVLNRVIQGVDPSADVNSVVGAFLGVGEQRYTVRAGDKSPVGRYDLRAFTVTEADIADYRQEGNVLYIRLHDCKNPQKNGSQTLSKVTAAFPTASEVRKEMQTQIGTAVTVSDMTSQVSDILLTVTLSADGVESIRLHFVNDLSLGLMVAIVSVRGTGQTTTDILYSDFVNG